MTLTNVFKDNTRDDIKNFIESKFLYGEVGTGTGTEDAADTSLEGSVFRDVIDEFDKTAVTDEITATFEIEPNEANGQTIGETGWFTTTVVGEMNTRNLVQPVIAKTSDIRIAFDTNITINVTEE